jgi:hypothetical protein
MGNIRFRFRGSLFSTPTRRLAKKSMRSAGYWKPRREAPFPRIRLTGTNLMSPDGSRADGRRGLKNGLTGGIRGASAHRSVGAPERTEAAARATAATTDATLRGSLGAGNSGSLFASAATQNSARVRRLTTIPLASTTPVSAAAPSTASLSGTPESRAPLSIGSIDMPASAPPDGPASSPAATDAPAHIWNWAPPASSSAVWQLSPPEHP